MSTDSPARIRTLALFQKRLEGDDALLKLARRRFREAGLGAEFYAETREEVDHLLRFRPFEEPVALHLGRGLDLFDSRVRREITGLARDFRGHVFGIVVHDQPEAAGRFDDYLSLLAEIDREFGLTPGAPMLFVEYAAGLEAGVFTEVFRRSRRLGHVSACIDIGHLAMREARLSYARRYPGRDIFSLTPGDPLLPRCIAGIQDSLDDAGRAVFSIVRELTDIGKPLHYHLHDGHPLSTASPFGISDHLSFLGSIRLPFEHEGSRDLPLAFGAGGLSRVIAGSLRNAAPVSYSLEIHPTGESAHLGDASDLFRHWSDRTNAEKTNHWLRLLAENHRLLRGILRNLTDPSTPHKGETL